MNSANVVNGSLTGSDLALSNVSSALQVRTAYAETPCAPTCGSPTPFYTQGPWTLTGTCVNDSTGTFHAKVELSSNFDDFVAVNNGGGQRVAIGNTTVIAQTGTVVNQSDSNSSDGGEFNAVVADSNVSNHISGHVLAVADGGASDGGSVGFCKFAFEGLGQ